MFSPAWVTQAQLTSALSAFRGQMPMTSSPRMLFQQEEVWGVWQGFLQSGILSREETKSQCSHVAPLFPSAPPSLCTCPSSCCSLPRAPFTPKDKFPLSLVLSLFPIMLLSMCGFGWRVGAPLSSQAGGLLSSDLAGPCCLPCYLVTSPPSRPRGWRKPHCTGEGLAKSWEMVSLWTCWVELGMGGTHQEGLCISKAQVRSKPVAQSGS